MALRSGLVHPRPPAPPEFTYYGGPVLGHTKVIEVLWRGNVQFATQLGQFYGAITNSEYFDLLGEYEGGGRVMGRGSFEALVTDPAPPGGDTVDDDAIQSELARLLHEKTVPANDADTVYIVHFPPGMTVTQGETTSCVDFCAYHGTFRRNDVIVPYAVIPDMGGACAETCGGADAFANTTWVASHEIIEAATDPAIGFAAKDPGDPLAWFDPDSGEISDACEGTAQIAGYVVQTQWSARDGKCRFGSSSTGSFVVGVSPSTQTVKAGTSATVVITTASTGPGATAIALSAHGFPDGVTATVAPETVAPGKNAILTLAASATATATTTEITISGATPSETESATATLTVEGQKPVNDFAVTATPVTQTVRIGQSVRFSVKTTVVSGTAESVVFSAGGLPAGVSASFGTASVIAGGMVDLTITASPTALPVSALVMITGTAHSRTHNATVSLDVASVPPVNDFSLAVAPPSATVVAGKTATYTVTTAVVSGSAQPIAFSVSGLPAGVTGSFAPASVSAGGQTTLTLTAAPDAAAVTGAAFALSGMAASGTHSTNASVTVAPAPPADDFSVALAPSTRTVQAGSSTTFTVSTAVVSGGAATIAFAISGVPSGVTAAFQPTSVTAGGSATLTIDAALTATVGTVELSVTGASSTGSHAATATVTVTAPPPPDFSIAVTPPSQTLTAGTSATYVVSTQVTSGSTEPVALSVTGLPAGVHGAITPATVTSGQTSSLTLTADSGITAPSTSFTVTGAATSGSHNAGAQVAVTAPPANDFSIAVNPGAASVAAGMTVSYTIATAVTSGNAQAVTLSVAGLPTGMTGAFSPGSVTAGQSATLTLSAAGGALLGTATFTVSGMGTALTRVAMADVTVVSQPTNLIDNGDFEDGLLDSWTVTRGNVTNVNINPHGGARSMKVGRSSGKDAASVVAQDVVVPATGTTTLTFWMYPRCEDDLDDIQYVSIVQNGVFDDLIASCSNASVFQHHTFDLTGYAGSTVTLLFEADVDTLFKTGSTWFYIDDVSVTNQP